MKLCVVYLLIGLGWSLGAMVWQREVYPEGRWYHYVIVFVLNLIFWPVAAGIAFCCPNAWFGS